MYPNQHLADKIAGKLEPETKVEVPQETPIESLCLLFVDLSIVESIDFAIQFENSEAFDNYAEHLRTEGRKNMVGEYFEVGVKEKDGTIVTETFADFKKRFDFKTEQP